MAKKILVLGGNGFMGKNIQELFKNTEHEMFYESRRTGCDVTNQTSLWECLIRTQPDIIIYASAHVGSMKYVYDNASQVVHDNTQMYLTLYKTVAQYMKSLRKEIIIINPISNCSYPGIIDIQNEEDWWSGQVHESVEAYGIPKKMGFIISEQYKKQYGIKTVNVIVPNSYGPNDYVDEERTHAMGGIVMRMMKSKLKGDKEFVVWGTGSPIREWIYMPDMARIFLHIIDNGLYDLPNPINIGQEHGISILDSVKLVKEALGYEGEITFDSTKQDGAPIKVLGKTLFRKYFPSFEFTGYDVGISETIEYYSQYIK